MKLAYGIDFGTTNSTIGVVKDGKLTNLHIDPESTNPAVMRSIIYINPQKKYLFGKPAVNAYLVDVAQSIGFSKRTIFTGRYIKIASPAGLGGFNNDQIVPEILEIEESEGGRLFHALKTVLSNETILNVNIFGENIKLEELVGKFIKEMKERADEIVGVPINKVVIGRPVKYVGNNQDLAKKRMEAALEYAGFNEVIFEYEPVGAALDYGINIKDKKIVLVFDFGGGTLDLSVFKFPERRVLANVGLAIGGDHFNTKIFIEKIGEYFGTKAKYGMKQLAIPRHILSALENWYKISLLKGIDFSEGIENFRFMSSNPKSIIALNSLVNNNLGFGVYEEVERVKKILTDKNEEIYGFVGKDIEIQHSISRHQFEQLIEEDLKNIQLLIQEALDKAGINTNQIDIVATTGGSSLIPAVRMLLNKAFEPEKIKDSDAFTSVASGLAIRASELFT